MRKLTGPQKAILVPLLGMFVAWLFFVGALLLDIVIPQWPVYDNMGNPKTDVAEPIRWQTYLFLAAIASIALSALKGQKLAIAARAQLGDGHLLGRAAQRFANLAIWIGLILGAVFALGNFLAAFGNNFSGVRSELLVRLASVYLPIILATVLEIYVILRAFVLRAESTEPSPEQTKGMSEKQKALALGYALPIIATAIAIVFGLVVFDVTRTNLDGWIWVIVQSIVIAGIVAGTRFATKARAGEVAAPRQRAVFSALAAGAANLNFVLSVVFGAVVSIIALTTTGTAIGKLRESSYILDGKEWETVIKPITWDWLIGDLAPAKVLVLLVLGGTYVTLVLRNRESKPQAINSAE